MADIKKAMDLVSKYRDPIAGNKLDRFDWRPLRDVHEDLQGLPEIPTHVEAFGGFMDEMAHRALKGQMSPRDLIKAYAITRSSIRRQAIYNKTLREKGGFILPYGDNVKIRPEGAMGEWLMTPMGQRYLDAAERGKVDGEAVADAAAKMRPYGFQNDTELQALPWAAQNLPSRHKEFSSLISDGLNKNPDLDAWRKSSMSLHGIKEAKSGFMGSLLGRGDQPTLDARQVVLQTGLPNEEGTKRMTGTGFSGVDRLLSRQTAMNPRLDPDLEPYRQHLTHHAIWDAAGNDKTTHEDLMTAMRNAKDGGRIGYATRGKVVDDSEAGTKFIRHPLTQAILNLGLPNADTLHPAVQEAIRRINTPFSSDPDVVKAALKSAETYRTKIGGETGSGSYFGIKQPVAPKDVLTTMQDIPGVSLKNPNRMTWDQAYQRMKGGTLINVGGDRSNLGRLTHINGKQLNWPVDLQAGPKYMLEPNKGAVWANSEVHTSAFNNKIREAAKRGPVYGIYSPMGPMSADTSHHMFDALMAQIDKDAISKEDAKEFDDMLKAGLHMGGDPKAIAYMEKWPGILNSKEASEFAKNIPGDYRGPIVKKMDTAYWRDRGFPHVGITRAAITDPDVFGTQGNMMGHRVVEFDPDKLRADEESMQHNTYRAASAGQYIGDVPLAERQVILPKFTAEKLKDRTVKGEVIHPYSQDPKGRETYRILTEQQKQLEPVDEHWAESVGRGTEKTPMKRGGKAKNIDRALALTSVYNRKHNRDA